MVSVAALGLTPLCCSHNILQIIVMRKEMLYVHVEFAQVKEKMPRDFQECTDDSAAARASFMRTSGIRSLIQLIFQLRTLEHLHRCPHRTRSPGFHWESIYLYQ